MMLSGCKTAERQEPPEERVLNCSRDEQRLQNSMKGAQAQEDWEKMENDLKAELE